MKPFFRVVLGLVTFLPAIHASPFHVEAGASYFMFNGTNLESRANLNSVDEPKNRAPFVGVQYDLGQGFGVRFSYQWVNEVWTTAEYGPTANFSPSPFPSLVWGYYHDDIDVISVSPEFALALTPRLSVGIAPQINWVRSRGWIHYSSMSPVLLLVAPQAWRDDGFTVGGSTRLQWIFASRAAASVSYQFTDLKPSFGRKAHVLTGSLQWRF